MAKQRTVDVFGVGNAIVDILAFVDEDFIRERDIARGTMTLVDSEQQGRLLHGLEGHPVELSSGGSAANTMVTIALSGGSGFYSGKVSRDTNGQFYREDLLEAGIHFDVHPAPESGDPTGTCVVLTTPDAERTMCTHLGVSTQLSATDINVDRLQQCQYSYIEGYLWDADGPRKASIEAMERSKELKVKIAVTFSDFFLVDRFRDDFHDVVNWYADVVFCNADEIRRFCERESLQECLAQLGALVDLAFVTDGPNGCFVLQQKAVTHVAGFPVDAVDTVGAGDAFAGGVLYGLTRGRTPQQAARWGNYLASRVVLIHGPRIKDSMKAEAAKIMEAE